MFKIFQLLQRFISHLGTYQSINPTFEVNLSTSLIITVSTYKIFEWRGCIISILYSGISMCIQVTRLHMGGGREGTTIYLFFGRWGFMKIEQAQAPPTSNAPHMM